MAVTKGSFQGQYYPAPEPDTLGFLQNTNGAKAMQSSVSRGRKKGMTGPGHDADDPRQLYSGHIGKNFGTIPSGSELHANRASTGKHGPDKVLIDGTPAPKTTGAGQGAEHLHVYAPVVQGSSTRVNRQQRRPDRFLGLRNRQS